MSFPHLFNAYSRFHSTTVLARTYSDRNVIAILLIISIGKASPVRRGGLRSIIWRNPKGGRRRQIKVILCCLNYSGVNSIGITDKYGAI